MKSIWLILLFVLVSIQQTIVEASIPLVVNTWSFTDPTIAAWETVFYNNLTAVDGLVDGCTVCETDVAHCGLSVGYGGNPNELGDTQLDAMIMDGLTMNTGAVGGIRNIRNAIRVARHVLENTRHSFLVGREATQFAVQMGFKLETTKTNGSISVWNNWRNNTCQPNFWMNVSPDPSQSCGPFVPKPIELPLNETEDSDVFKIEDKFYHEIGPDNHDTIGMIVIDKDNNLAAGTSTNGLRYKIPGRVGDSPIIGAGAYADNKIGAAVGTGNGDVMMRFLPSLLAVELMRSGLTPAEAAHRAIERIIPYYPAFSGAVLVTDKDGNYDAACHGMTSFPFSVYTTETGNIMQSVACF